jgi:hypothetical protein
MAAQAGTLVLVGQSGRTYTLDAYVPDGVATFFGLNASGLAASTSPTTWRAPEACKIVDFSIGAAPTAVGAILQLNNTNANGGTIRHANQLAANPSRMKLNLPVRGGDFISFLQF